MFRKKRSTPPLILIIFFLAAAMVAVAIPFQFSDSAGRFASEFDTGKPGGPITPYNPPKPPVKPYNPPPSPPVNHIVHGTTSGGVTTTNPLAGDPDAAKHLTTDGLLRTEIGSTGDYYVPQYPLALLDPTKQLQAVWLDYNYPASGPTSIKLSTLASGKWTHEDVLTIPSNNANYLRPLGFVYEPSFGGSVVIYHDVVNNYPVYYTINFATKKAASSNCGQGWTCTVVQQTSGGTRFPGYYYLPENKPLPVTVLPGGNIFMVLAERRAIGGSGPDLVYQGVEIDPSFNVVRKEALLTLVYASMPRGSGFDILDVEVDPATNEPIVLLGEIQSGPPARNPLYILKKSLSGCSLQVTGVQLGWGCALVAPDSQWKGLGAELVMENGPTAYYFYPAGCNPCSLYKSYPWSTSWTFEDTQLGTFSVGNHAIPSNWYTPVSSIFHLDVEKGTEGTHIAVAEFQYDLTTRTVSNGNVFYAVYGAGGTCGKSQAYKYCVRLKPHTKLPVVGPLNPDLAVQ